MNQNHLRLLSASLAAALLQLLSIPASAGVWHVANTGGVPRDFTSVTEAITSPLVQEGDTIIISGPFTESVTLNRRLHLVGYGYFHTENGITHPPTTQMPASIGALTILPGTTTRPDGGSVTGLRMTDCALENVDGFTLRRCNLQTVSIGGSEGTMPARGILIIQNYLRGHPSGFYNNATITSPAYDNSNTLISNNIILASDEGNILLSAGDALVFLNNVFLPGPAGPAGVGLAGAGIFSNNITYGSVSGHDYFSVTNNLAIVGSYLPAANGNLNGQAEADVFVLGASPDAKYQLKAGSPAIGAGLEGQDIGAYGGNYPYVTSGLPPLPVITNLSAPLTTKDGATLSVQIRVEVHP